jgi:hypothetical protein
MERTAIYTHARRTGKGPRTPKEWRSPFVYNRDSNEAHNSTSNFAFTLQTHPDIAPGNCRAPFPMFIENPMRLKRATFALTSGDHEVVVRTGNAARRCL